MWIMHRPCDTLSLKRCELRLDIRFKPPHKTLVRGLSRISTRPPRREASRLRTVDPPTAVGSMPRTTVGTTVVARAAGLGATCTARGLALLLVLLPADISIALPVGQFLADEKRGRDYDPLGLAVKRTRCRRPTKQDKWGKRRGFASKSSV